MDDEASYQATRPLLPPASSSSTSRSAAGADSSGRKPPASRSADEILSVPVSLRVRFSDGTEDLLLELPSRALIGRLRENIYRERPNFSGKYLRLIHHGRELPETKRIGELVPASGPTDIWIH
ncbi:hypothetical protein SYNPS1DRAFT_24833, partial [Syncephalis pseudoplumigaleata]